MTRNANERDRSMTNADEQTQLCFLPATELAARIRRRDLSPVEVMNAYLDRIGERNPVINAYTTVLADRALDAARAAERDVAAGRPLGPLHGVPVAIKDLDDVAGVPTSMGSLAVRDKIPARNAAAVDRLEQAGAIVLGKTNSPEFGHKGTTDNLRFGPTSTPWATGKNSGGSSGGSAAAVAARGTRRGHRRRRLRPHPRGILRRGRLQGVVRSDPVRHPARCVSLATPVRPHWTTRPHGSRCSADGRSHERTEQP
jgi:hypothetical protein